MKLIVADEKRRVVLPNIRPGDAFAVRELEEGRLELVRMIPACEAAPPERAEVRRRLSEHALRPAMRWTELRSLTRDPD